MKQSLRRLFAPILNYFEQGDTPYQYVPSHRWVTIAVGCLFMVLVGVSIYLSIISNSYGAVLPMIAFGCVGIVSLVVGCLGNDRAIAKIWNTQKN